MTNLQLRRGITKNVLFNHQVIHKIEKVKKILIVTKEVVRGNFFVPKGLFCLSIICFFYMPPQSTEVVVKFLPLFLCLEIKAHLLNMTPHKYP